MKQRSQFGYLAVVAAMVIGIAMGLCGCVPQNQPTANNNPTANAGSAQTVLPSATVTLTGAASSDPDSDALTYAWAQLAGTAVTLTGANTVSPSFTAPSGNATLVFQLTVSDGRGGTGTAVVTVYVAAGGTPTANAGPAQTVLPSAAVTLTGAASTDPDGDTLTYAWTQTLGTAVALTGANTVSPTFTAPATNATLVFQLTVNDGHGGTSSATVTILVVSGGGSTVTPTLFVTSAAGPNVVGFAYPWVVSGNAVPNTVLTGSATRLILPWAAVAISNGTLLVSNIDGTGSDHPSLTGYANAASATGNLAPSLEVTGAATSLVSPRSMAYHAATDTLLVADLGAPSILVYPNVSQSSFHGNVAPTRIITSTSLSGPQGIYLTAAGDLYVANNGNNTIAVFANAHTANGPVTATRTITSTALANAGSLQAVCVDQSDHLFAADAGGKVFMFNGASTLTGAATPAATLQVQTAITASLTAIAVDSAGHGYVLDGGANSAVYVYDSIATRSGTLAPDRTITGPATNVVLPQRLYMWE